MMQVAMDMAARSAELIDKAKRLLQFLCAMQEMRTRPVRSVDEFPRVYWLSELPTDDPGCSVAWGRGADPLSDLWITVDRVERAAPPSHDPRLESWISHADLWNSSLEQPELLDQVDQLEVSTTDLEAVEQLYAEWLPRWRAWADVDRKGSRRRHAYNEIYALMQEQRGQVETLEVVLGVGLLNAYSAGTHVRRHIVTVPAHIDLDMATGRLTVKADPERPVPRLEEDMLSPLDRVLATDADAIAADLEGATSIFGGDVVEHAIRAWTNTFRPDAVFAPDFEGTRSQPGTVTLAPALILRRRGRESFIQAINTVLAAIESGAEIPPGLAQIMLDPEGWDTRPAGGAISPGAVIDPEVYFPHAANDEQREIVQRLREERVVVVQGPPGTGKTHTIANLVTDLLAHGQRVLITSHGSRALKILKDKLPQEVRDLCVSLTDTSVRGQQDLQRSVETIIDRVSRQSVGELNAEHQRFVRELERARAARTKALDSLRRIRDQEMTPVTSFPEPYVGSPTEVAQRAADDEARYGWIGQPDLAIAQVRGDELRRLAELAGRVTDETRQEALPRPRDCLTPDGLRSHLDRLQRLSARLQRVSDRSAGIDDLRLESLSQPDTDKIRQVCESLAGELRELAALARTWTNTALQRLWLGEGNVVAQTRVELARGLGVVQSSLAVVDHHHVTGLERIDVAMEAGRLNDLAQHLASGGAMRRFGRTTRPARQAEAALAAIRVDGRVCTTADDVRVAAAACHVESQLRSFEQIWGSAQAGESQAVRAVRAESTIKALDRVLGLQSLFDAARALGATVGSLRHGRWWDVDWVEELLDLVSGEHVRQEQARIAAAIRASATELRRHAEQLAEPRLAAAASALETGDVQAYSELWPSLARRWDLADMIRDFEAQLSRLEASIPTVADSVLANPAAELWEARSHLLEDAYVWAAADAQLRSIVNPATEKSLRAKLQQAEGLIKRCLLGIASNRSWVFCQSRMTPVEQQNLKIYATSTKRIGKGTGKHANRYRREARAALAKAQGAVPAWIMPLRSVVDTVPFDRPGVFDVVIIDEASQSGHEALLLLWLGKRLLVVGDEEQISPESVGIDQDGIFRQQEELLYDFPTRPIFGPTNSFIDHASTLARNPIMLLEHFRCMPEIIEFSNRLSYNRRLLPVRQFGADRLPPLRRTYVRNGRGRGTAQRVENRAEATALVDAVERCCTDPAYAKKSMGVITFLGSAQAGLISDMLLDRLGAIEMERRGLRVDKPEAFQGDERDVIFLSLVATLDGEEGPRRIGPMTKRSDQQRLNVTASRARDQVWVFHSVLPDLLNGGDFRRHYLEYLTQPAVDPVDDELAGSVSPDVLNPAFESDFEQRVYLAIVRRGYRVRPQYRVGRFRIDLVIEGGAQRLAVECDGDGYHDRDTEVDDVHRQLELERLGWTFWRIRGSQFYRDPESSLVELWGTLDRLGIRPSASRTDVSIVNEVSVSAGAAALAEIEQFELADRLSAPEATRVVVRDGASPPVPASIEMAPVGDVSAVPPGNGLALGPRSFQRLKREVNLIREELARGLSGGIAGDSRLLEATRRNWERRRADLEERVGYLESVLERAVVAPKGRVDGEAWPGAVIRYRDLETDEVTDAIVCAVELEDESTERVSPFWTLGKLLADVRPGQRITFLKRNGRQGAVEIISISD